MANIAVNEFTYKSIIDKDTIIVSVSADGKLIKELEFGVAGYTVASAEESVRVTAENFGILGPGNNDLYEKSKTPATTPSSSPTSTTYKYEIESQGPRHYIIVYQISSTGEKEIFKGDFASVSTVSVEDLKREAINALSATFPDVQNMEPKTPVTASSPTPTTYKYEIKKIAIRTYIIVYEVGRAGEKEIYKGPEVVGASAEVLVDTAILDLENQYPGVRGMTVKTPQLPPVPAADPPIIPPPSPLPENAKSKEPIKYVPKAKYKDSKTAEEGEFVILETEEPYSGPYIELSGKRFFAGESPEQNGAELYRIEKTSLNPAALLPYLSTGLSLFALLQSAIKKELSQDEVDKGVAKRYFVQDNRDKKISETTEELFEEGKVTHPDFIYTEVPWLFRNPVEDIEINGIKYKGSESRNKETIQRLESTMPGISQFVTDYTFLSTPTPPPRPEIDQERRQTQVVEDASMRRAVFRKANFDTRN